MEKIKETLENVKNFIIFAYILLIIFVTICLLSYNEYKMTVFGKNTLIPIIDENLEPDYTIGDLVVVPKNMLSSVEAGDKIFFYRTASGETTINYATVTKSERVTDTEFTYTVEGDYRFSSSNFIGKTDTATVIPFVGRVLSTLQSKWGFLFLGVFPSLVAFLTTLHYVIVEIQEEKERKEQAAIKAAKKKKKKKKLQEEKAAKVEKELQTEVVEDEKEEVVEEKIETKIQEVEEEQEEVVEVSVEIEKEEEIQPEEKVEIEEKEVEVSIEVQKEEVKTEPAVEVKVEKEEVKEIKIEEKVNTEEMSAEQKKKAMIEAKMKSMTEEEKRALIEAKLKAMSPEEKRALIEAKKKKMEADKK